VDIAYSDSEADLASYEEAVSQSAAFREQVSEAIPSELALVPEAVSEAMISDSASQEEAVSDNFIIPYGHGICPCMPHLSVCVCE
jgi:hypothetical protein